MQRYDLVDRADAELLTVAQEITSRPPVGSSSVRVPDRGLKVFQDSHRCPDASTGHQSRHGQGRNLNNQLAHTLLTFNP